MIESHQSAPMIGGMSLASNFQSPRDPGGFLPMGTEATMGEDPTGTFALDECSDEISFQNSQNRVPPPPTPTRLAEVPAASPHVLALLAGFPPPPPPETPPPSRRRRSKSTPRVSNSKSASSGLPSEVRFASAENQEVVAANYHTGMPTSTPRTMPFPFKAVVDDCAYAEQRSSDEIHLPTPLRRLSAISSLDPPASATHVRVPILSHSQATPRLVVAAGQENKSPERVNSANPQRSPVSDVTEPTRNHHPPQGVNPGIFQPVTTSYSVNPPFLENNEVVGAAASDFNNMDQQSHIRSKSSERMKHRSKTPERLRRVLNTGLSGGAHRRNHSDEVALPNKSGVDVQNPTFSHRRSQTMTARVEFTNGLVQNGDSKSSDLRIVRANDEPTSNSSFAHTVSTGVTSGKSLSSVSEAKNLARNRLSKKAPKRNFFQKLFGGKRKTAREPQDNETKAQNNRQKIAMAPQKQSSQVSVPGTALKTEIENAPLVLPERANEPADEDHGYERGSVFFAHDEVSTLTAPTMESYYCHRDPTEENERVSEPLGHHWSNFGGVSATRDDTGFPSIDPFTEPFFQEPSGASPMPKTASLDLRIHVPQISDPIGESPLNSLKAKPVRHSHQPHLHDPSPQGFKTTLPFSGDPTQDPIGESPLHKHERGPTGLIDGSPYAPDPPLYLVALENETSSNLENNSSSESNAGERDTILGFSSGDSPSNVPPAPTVLPPRPPSPKVTSQAPLKSSPRRPSHRVSPVMINPLSVETAGQSSVGTKGNSIAKIEIFSGKSCGEKSVELEKPGVESSSLHLPADTAIATNHAKQAATASGGPVDSDETLRLLDASSCTSFTEKQAEGSPSNSVASKPSEDPSPRALSQASSFESSDSQSTRSIRAKAFLKKRRSRSRSRSRSKSKSAEPGTVSIDAVATTNTDVITQERSLLLFDSASELVAETPSPRRFSPRAALKARAQARRKGDGTAEEESGKAKSKQLTMSAAARMNARTVAYLHTMNGEEAPSHEWRSAGDTDDEPSPRLMLSKTTKADCIATSRHHDPSKPADSESPRVAPIFSPYKEKFKGRGLTKNDPIRNPSASKAPVEKADAMALAIPSSTKGNPLGRDIGIHPVAVKAGMRLLRERQNHRFACGQAKRVTPVRRAKTPRAQSYFGPLSDPEPKDPIQRAGRRLLAKSAVPVQAAARRFLAKRKAVDRMWALLELQSCFRRWRAEAALVASREAAKAIQRSFLRSRHRRILTSQKRAAVQIQKIVRGFIYAIRVYEDVFRIIRIQARARSTRCRRDFTSQKTSSLKIQTAYRASRSRRLKNRNLRGITRIQAQWRAYLIRTCFQFVVVDIIITQSVVRRWLARKQYVSTLTLRRHDAATRIQSEFKAFSIRLMSKRSKSACLLQASWRCCRQKYLYRQHCSAKCIQSKWRGFCVLSLYRAHCAATKIQTSWRRYRAMKFYRQFQAANLIQATYRGVRCQKQYKKYRAATRIQAAWRGFQGYTDYVFTLVDVLVVQRSIRRWRAKKEFMRRRRERAALRLQSYWRCHKARLCLLVNLMRIILTQVSEFNLALHISLLSSS